MKRYLFVIPLLVLACSLWTAPAAMHAPQPTPSPGGVTSWPTPTDTATPTPHNCTVTAPDALNLRSGPGVGFDVIGWLYYGDTLRTVGASGAWLEVDTLAGRGWVHGSYCK